MRAQTILFLVVDRVMGKLDCRPYRGGGEGNPNRLVEAASRAFSNRSNILTIRVGGRAVTVVPVQTAEQSLGCQILFIASSQDRQSRQIIDTLRNTSVLTVGETACL